MRYIALIVLVLALAACGGSQVTHSPSTSAPSVSASTPKGTPSPPAASSGYPQEAADKALCTTYQSLSQNGDFADIPVAVASADGSVTQNLADVMSRQGTTLQQDEQNDVLVAANCALVSVGKSPTISHF
jgi:hypothetical protein